MAKLITKRTHLGDRFAVEFETAKGRMYRTLWTSFRDEACTWGRTIEAHRWCMSARPTPVH